MIPLQHIPGKGSEGESAVKEAPARADLAASPGSAIHDRSTDSVLLPSLASISSSTKWEQQCSHRRLAAKIHTDLSVG